MQATCLCYKMGCNFHHSGTLNETGWRIKMSDSLRDCGQN